MECHGSGAENRRLTTPLPSPGQIPPAGSQKPLIDMLNEMAARASGPGAPREAAQTPGHRTGGGVDRPFARSEDLDPHAALVQRSAHPVAGRKAAELTA